MFRPNPKYFRILTAKLQAQAEFDANVKTAEAILGDVPSAQQMVLDSLHQSAANIQASLNRLQS